MSQFLFLLVTGLFTTIAQPAGDLMNRIERSLFIQGPVGLTNSPFYNESYKYGEILFNRGRKISNVKLRIDLFTKTAQFISFNEIEAILDPGTVKQVSYSDTTTDGIIFYKFKTGFPAIDGKTADNFYIVLAEGNCNLLRSVEKKVHERRNDMRGNFIRDYETFDFFYLQVKGEMKKLKKDKEFLLAELSDKKAQLELFIEQHKLNLRNIESITKLINHYNTL